MKNFSVILILLITLSFSACVNRIDIPEDQESMLYINLEMLKGQSEFVADFKTTNNLNGTFPIYPPHNAEIKIIQLNPQQVDVNNEVFLHYDPISEKYVSDSETNIKFLSHGKKYKLEASVEGTDFDIISSTTIVPYPIQIDSIELLSEEVVQDDDNDYWQGTVGFVFIPSVNSNSRYGHLHITGMKTFKEEIPGQDPMYTVVEEEGTQYFDLIDINVGSPAVTDIVHRDGYLMDFEKLDNNYIEVVIKSPFAITDPKQVTDILSTNLVSISEEHFNYHKALHNIKRSEENIFEENALYRSNIDKGLGLFSTCHESPKMHNLR